MTRMLDSLTPAEIREAVLAIVTEDGWAEIHQLLDRTALRLDSSRSYDALPPPGPWGSRREAEMVVVRYNGRVTRALEGLAADGVLIKIGKDQPGPEGSVTSGVQYYTPAAWVKAKNTADEAQAAAAGEALRWDLVANRLDAVEVHLAKNGSLSLADWEHLLEATGL